MKRTHLYLGVAVCTVGLTTACPTAPEQAPNPTPPIGDVNEDVVDDIEEPDPIDNPGPVVPEPQDCNALEYNGGTVNCSELLNTDNFCANVYEGTYSPENPNFGLISACGTCNSQYFASPGVTCDGIGEIAPPPPPPPAPEQDESCYRCHAPAGYDGNHSIEDPHVWNSVQCTQCHGGDGTANNPVFAHVCPPPEVGNRQQQILDPRAFFLSFTTAGVQFLPNYECLQQDGTYRATTALEWLAFENPGDLRAGEEGLGCGACHGVTAEDPATGEEYIKGGNVVGRVKRSVMGNATGLNSGTRHGIGAPNKFAERNSKTVQYDWNSQADYGATAVTDPNYDPNTRSVGQVPSLAAPEVFTGIEFRDNQAYTAAQVDNSYELNQLNADNYPNGMANFIAEQLFQEVLNQACTGCHLQNKYNNNRAGDYRTAGCAACHFSTGALGRSASQDPNVPKIEPFDPNNLAPGEKSHVADHRIRNVAKLPGPGNPNLRVAVQGVGDNNCIVCHEGSNRTVAQFHGYRLDQGSYIYGNDDFNVVNQLGDLVNNLFFPSNNTVTFANKTELFGENQQFNNRFLTQWIDKEVWQADVANLVNQEGQDETPEDIHHESGMGCIDCHGTGALHGRGQIYSRMKVQTHENDVLCETCHGTLDAYAENDGANIVDQGGYPLANTIVNNALNGDFWLISKLNGSQHYIPQVKDIVNAADAGGNKRYPPGSTYAGQPVFNLVASYAMGRYQDQQDLTDGYGPVQPNNANIVMTNNFSHSDGFQYSLGNVAQNNQGLECYTCHAAWQNNCIGCHLDSFYDANPANFFFSQVSGERIYFNFNAFFIYQNPIDFMMGINDRSKISPMQGLHRWFRYTDLNNDTSNYLSHGDRNGLGNDPQLRNANRNNLPALQNQPFTPHSIRGKASDQKIGLRGCLDCHIPNANAVFVTDQVNDNYDLTAFIADQENYATSIPYQVEMAMGRENTGLFQFDANGLPVFFSNDTPAFDVYRLVEDDGTTNSSANHPLLDPFGANGSNPDYNDFVSQNNARMTRPLSGQVLQRLIRLNDVYGGLGDVYYYNGNPGTDPADFANGGRAYNFLKDLNYITAAN